MEDEIYDETYPPPYMKVLNRSLPYERRLRQAVLVGNLTDTKSALAQTHKATKRSHHHLLEDQLLHSHQVNQIRQGQYVQLKERLSLPLAHGFGVADTYKTIIKVRVVTVRMNKQSFLDFRKEHYKNLTYQEKMIVSGIYTTSGRNWALHRTTFPTKMIESRGMYCIELFHTHQQEHEWDVPI
jgi:hypothetical protein